MPRRISGDANGISKGTSDVPEGTRDASMGSNGVTEGANVITRYGTGFVSSGRPFDSLGLLFDSPGLQFESVRSALGLRKMADVGLGAGFTGPKGEFAAAERRFVSTERSRNRLEGVPGELVKSRNQGQRSPGAAASGPSSFPSFPYVQLFALRPAKGPPGPVRRSNSWRAMAVTWSIL